MLDISLIMRTNGSVCSQFPYVKLPLARNITIENTHKFNTRTTGLHRRFGDQQAGQKKTHKYAPPYCFTHTSTSHPDNFGATVYSEAIYAIIPRRLV